MTAALAFAVVVGGCDQSMLGGPDGGSPTASDASVDAAVGVDGGAAPDAGAPDGGGGLDPDGGATPVPDDCPRARVQVAAGNTLNLRPSPSTDGEPVTALPNRAFLDVLGRVTGEVIEGNDEWLHVRYSSYEGFVSAVYAECTTDEAPVLELDGFYLPLACETSARISQGNFGEWSHSGRARYGFDFAIAVGTPMVAMADGEVLHVYDATDPGDRCYDGGGSDCYPYANLVVLMHADGTTTIYKHLSEVLVSLGEVVPRGEAVGLSGSSGYSTGPHAHIMRQEDCGEANCESLPMQFEDVPGDGVPDTGDTVTSGNCP